ncbi:uncharacterized protein LOC122398452 [Colletes gigas]|uniref:uncharacterized protein LOC122398452 n=1 Tax=Colletes gigas TaxID=935657 RepID=UPI001C9B9347|nr:uncharacterized protein LOC122398452 [Colletes gigas]
MRTMKDELFRWICEKYATDSFLDRRIVREKALELTKTHGLSSFKCSNNWITNFLKDHGFSADLTNRTGPIFGNYRDWIDLMRSTIVKYKHSDLFHADELTMYSDALPTMMETTGCTELPRNRVTVLLGCNSSGTTKLPLLICGSYPSRTTTKDHVYCHSQDSSISDELFSGWLSTVDDRMSRCNSKILLFLKRNRARAARDLPLTNTSIVYLPDDFPPYLRPLRRDVFHYVKMIFRRRYAERLMRYTSEWNLRDVLESLIDAWERVPQETIVYSFQRTRFRIDDCFMRIDCDCWPSLNTGVSFKRFVTFDDDLSDDRWSVERSNRHHSYNLRASNRDAAQVKKDEASCAPQDDEEIDRKPDCAMVTDSGEPPDAKNRVERQNWLTKSRKRAYSEIQCSSKKQSDDRETIEDASIPSTFATKDPRVDRSRSIGDEAFKRGTHQRRRAIIDKAFALTTSGKADLAKKLIDNVYASNQEARKHFGRQDDMETGCSYVPEEETVEPILSNALVESDRPSTSTNDWEALSETITQNAYEVIRSHPVEELIKGNETLSKHLDGLEERSDSSESSEKKMKTDHDWSKQYETTFVFGLSGSPNATSCSSGQHHGDENIVEPCTLNATPSASPRN